MFRGILPLTLSLCLGAAATPAVLAQSAAPHSGPRTTTHTPVRPAAITPVRPVTETNEDTGSRASPCSID